MKVTERLHALGQDIERLLISGSAQVTDDDSLRASRQTLASAAAQVPALARLTDQIDKTIAAASDQTTRELLDLAVMAEQILTALASADAAEGELMALPPLPPIGTPLPIYEIEPLHFGLVMGTRGRTRVPLGSDAIVKLIKDAMARDIVCDLRLIDAWISAAFLHDYKLGQQVQAEVLPRLVGELASEGAQEAMRWCCDVTEQRHYHLFDHLVKGGGAHLRNLLVRACEQGPFGAYALVPLAHIDAEKAEKIAVSVLSEECVMENLNMQQSAAAALGITKSAAALEALLAATKGRVPGARWSIGHALKSFPQSIARVMDRLEAYREAGLRTEYEYGVFIIESMIEEARPEPRVLPFLIDIWAKGAQDNVLTRAGKLIIKLGTDVQRELVTGLVDDENEIDKCRTNYTGPMLAAIYGIFEMGAETAYDRLSKYFQRDWLVRQQGCAMIACIVDRMIKSENGIDPRWLDRCVELLNDQTLLELPCTYSLGQSIYELGETHLSSYQYGYYVDRLCETLLIALGLFRDQKAVSALLRCLQEPPDIKDAHKRIGPIITVLARIGGAANAAALRDWALQHNGTEEIRGFSYRINELLKQMGAKPIKGLR